MIRPRALALVVLPAATNIVRSDIAGRPAVDHLLERLANLEAVEVGVLTEDASVASAPLEGHRTIPFPLTDRDAADLASREVILIDARSWLPDGLPAAILSRVREEAAVRRLALSSEGGHRGATVAVFLPPGRLRPGLLQTGRIPSGGGLEQIVASAARADIISLDSTELDGSAGALLIDSFSALAAAERQLLLDRARVAMESGVRIRDPHYVWLRGDLICEGDVELEIDVLVEGRVVLGAGVRVGPHCVLRDSRIGQNTQVKAYTLVEGADIGPESTVGPYGRIRPGSSIADHVQIGNYVEIKNTQIGRRSRINHHAFVGDATVGEDVTIGAGTITCNHDGLRINRTTIESGAYIGSGCNLVAPVVIGRGATVGAGSTITRDVPEAKLTLARSKQITIETWRPKRS